ncbi:MAG: hypothetical protein QOG75_7529 [Mycobacterium sp.]|jgi:hypothetical protein|nr:hypothetical protein [Mycobacterium sp.]
MRRRRATPSDPERAHLAGASRQEGSRKAEVASRCRRRPRPQLKRGEVLLWRGHRSASWPRSNSRQARLSSILSTVDHDRCDPIEMPVSATEKCCSCDCVFEARRAYGPPLTPEPLRPLPAPSPPRAGIQRGTGTSNVRSDAGQPREILRQLNQEGKTRKRCRHRTACHPNL